MSETIKELQEVIRRAVDQDGPFSHNIISLALRKCAKEHGTARANKLVDKFRLDKRYGIMKQEESK